VRGQLHQAAELFEQAIQQGGDIPINALAYMDLAEMGYEWNQLDLCEKHLEKAIDMCQHSRNFEFLVGALMIQSRMKIAQGDLPGAEKALAQAWNLTQNEPIPASTVDRLNAAQVNLLLVKGESPGEWAENLHERVDCHSYYRFLGVTKARTLPVQPALAYLGGLSKAAKENNWVFGLITAKILQATLVESQEEAVGLLIEALQLAASGDFIRSFMVGEKVIPLLRQAVRQGADAAYVNKLLEALAGSLEEGGKVQASLLEPLSERELEVLNLLAQGMTNRQIAEELVVSISTVKSHVHHISNKLDADNRTQAVSKARESGLL
jgi:LuxR family maltose regulon positive regulatory protein